MKKTILTPILFLLIAIAFSACKKDDAIGTFILKGRLLKTTDSTAAAGHAVTAIFQNFKAGTSGDFTIETIGVTTSSNDGYFEMTCDWYGALPYYSFDERDIQQALHKSSFIPDKDNSIVDVGVLYIK